MFTLGKEEQVSEGKQSRGVMLNKGLLFRLEADGKCGRRRRKYHFLYLHVFQIIQNGRKYYIIVNNQSIINHDVYGRIQTRQHTYSAAENHKQHSQ
jgi:hypothetical protein